MTRNIALCALAFSSNLAFAEVISWDCTYNHVASVKGVKSIDADSFSLAFKMDVNTKQAFMIGNNGLSEVQYWYGDRAVTFLEALPSGGMQTTIIAHLDSKSVHSRGTIMGTKLIPSQYYGQCIFSEDK